VVVADHPEDLVVGFGGIPSLDGQATGVESDGSFCLTIRLQNDEEGMATAQTTGLDGQPSNIAEYYVHQSNGAVVVNPVGVHR
jgi:hypothetical protein